jgi:hypothetical protein
VLFQDLFERTDPLGQPRDPIVLAASLVSHTVLLRKAFGGLNIYRHSRCSASLVELPIHGSCMGAAWELPIHQQDVCEGQATLAIGALQAYGAVCRCNVA